MAADTAYSPQEVLNLMYSGGRTDYSEQAVANLHASQAPTQDSWQAILNRSLSMPPTFYSIQEALHIILATPLGLTGGPTELSIQALLNRAYAAGLDLDNVMGAEGPELIPDTNDGSGTWGLLMLMAQA